MQPADNKNRSPLGLLGLLELEQRLSPAVARQLDLQLQASLQFHLHISRTGDMPAARRHAMLAELCQLGIRVVALTGLAARMPAEVLPPAIDEVTLADTMEDLGHLARVRLWTAQGEQIFDLLARLFVHRPCGHLGQAMLRLEKGHFHEAGALFETVQRLAPDHQQARLGLGMLHLLAGRFRLTVDCLAPLQQTDSESGRTARAMLSLPELRSYL